MDTNKEGMYALLKVKQLALEQNISLSEPNDGETGLFNG